MKKIPLYILVLVPFIWGLATVPINHAFVGLLKVMFVSPIWLYPPLIVYDMVMAAIGKNSEYLREFYSDIKNEIIVATGGALMVVVIYASGGVKYDASSFDIITTAIPFLLMGVISMAKLSRVKIVDMPMKKKAYRAYMTMIGMGYALIAIVTLRVTHHTYTLVASTWWQITILCVSLFVYIEAKRIAYVIKKERMETSPIWLNLFGVDGPYALLTQLCEHWNHAVCERRKQLEESFVETG